MLQTNNPPRASGREDQASYRWLLALFALIVLEGALRKWVVPASLHPLVFVSKDLLAVIFILRHPIPRSAQFERSLRDGFVYVGALLLPTFVYGVLQDWQGAVTIYKNAFLWGLLATHLAPRLHTLSIDRFIRVLALVTIAMALLGVLQYSSPIDSYINRYAWSEMDPTNTLITGYASNGGVRATGTFSYITGMSSFSVFSFALLIWRLARGCRNREFWIMTAGAIAAVCCGLTSGSRFTSVVFVGLTGMSILFSRNVKSTLRTGLVIAISGLFLVYVFDQRIVASFAERWTLEDTEDHGVGRAIGTNLRGNYLELLSNNPWGVGMGQKSGVAEFRSQTQGTELENYDWAATRGIVEGGVLGFLAELILQIMAVVFWVRGLSSRQHTHRLCSAILGSLLFYWLFSCNWHDHNTTALGALLLAFWTLISKDIGKRLPEKVNVHWRPLSTVGA